MRKLRLDRRSNLLVTLQAEFRQLLPHKTGLIGKMRIVAGRASVLFHRAVDHSAVDESVTGSAENSGRVAGRVRHLDPKQTVRQRAMRGMAGNASGVRKRPMRNTACPPVSKIRVTIEAEGLWPVG